MLGGEPLLHPNLPDLLRSVRRSGICDTIRVITNGRKLPVMASAFWELVDEVSISSYPGEELSEDELAAVEAVAARHEVRVKRKEFRFFRESYSEIACVDDELVERIYRTCQMAHVWRCHTYWNGRLYRCPQSLFLPLVLHGSIEAIEGLPLEPDPGLLHRLLEFLQAPAPLASCRHCLGSVGTIIPHRQGRRSTWRDMQRLPVTELLDQPHLALLLAEPGLLVRDTSYLEPS